MHTYNFLFVPGGGKEKEGILENLRTTLIKDIKAVSQFEIGLFDFAFSRSEVNEKIKSGLYDVVICSEDLGGEKIGSGSVKLWAAEYPDVKVILLVSKEHKGKIKMSQLFQKAVYFNALYFDDLTGANICKLIAAVRTDREAARYYGLNKELDAEKPMEEALEETENDQSISGLEKMETAEAFGMEFDELMRQAECEIIQPDLGNENTKEIPKETATDGIGESTSFVFPQMPDKIQQKELMSNQNKENTFMFELPQIPIVNPGCTSSHPTGLGDRKLKAGMYQEEILECGELVIVARGLLCEVVDEDTILVRIKGLLSIPQEMGLDEFKFRIRIKSGERGLITNGRFVSQNIAFEACVESMVSSQSALMTVFDYECVSNRDLIEGRECDLILTKM